MNTSNPPIALVIKTFCIDSLGKLYRKLPQSDKFSSEPVGTLGRDGYLRVNLDGIPKLVHRLAWVLYYGDWPEDGRVIDHINGNKTDNRIENLRAVSQLVNVTERTRINKNNITGVRGVSISGTGKYEASLTVQRKKYYGGTFDTIEEAILARKELEQKHRSII